MTTYTHITSHGEYSVSGLTIVEAAIARLTHDGAAYELRRDADGIEVADTPVAAQVPTDTSALALQAVKSVTGPMVGARIDINRLKGSAGGYVGWAVVTPTTIKKGVL